jgi:hypothetical protein
VDVVAPGQRLQAAGQVLFFVLRQDLNGKVRHTVFASAGIFIRALLSIHISIIARPQAVAICAGVPTPWIAALRSQ